MVFVLHRILDLINRQVETLKYLIRRAGDLGIEKHEILHVAESLFYDYVPAQRHGLMSCRIQRRKGMKGFGVMVNHGHAEDVKPQFEFDSMKDLVEAHKTELSACQQET